MYAYEEAHYYIARYIEVHADGILFSDTPQICWSRTDQHCAKHSGGASISRQISDDPSVQRLKYDSSRWLEAESAYVDQRRQYKPTL